RIMESSEAATRISNVRLGIDLGIIKHLDKNILNELMVLTQPGFMQSYAKTSLTANERDVLRATLIRERLSLEEGKEGFVMMFGKFTERAQKVLALSQEEAKKLRHKNRGTEHIILGLDREGEGIAEKALIELSLEVKTIQVEVEKWIGKDEQAE